MAYPLFDISTSFVVFCFRLGRARVRTTCGSGCGASMTFCLFPLRADAGVGSSEGSVGLDAGGAGALRFLVEVGGGGVGAMGSETADSAASLAVERVTLRDMRNRSYGNDCGRMEIWRCSCNKVVQGRFMCNCDLKFAGVGCT
jgi:hypothetical protein